MYYTLDSDPRYAYNTVEIIHNNHSWNFAVDWDTHEHADDAGRYIVGRPEVTRIDMFTDGRRTSYERFKLSTGLNLFDVQTALERFLDELEAAFNTIHPADIPASFTHDYVMATRIV